MTSMVRNEYALLSATGKHVGEVGAFIWMVREDAPDALEADLNRWYDQEHLPLVTSIGTVRGVRRYRATVGTPRFLTVYDLANAEIVESEAWRRSFQTPGAGILDQRTEVLTNLARFYKYVDHDEALREMAKWPE